MEARDYAAIAKEYGALELQATGNNVIGIGVQAGQLSTGIADAVLIGVKSGRYMLTGTGATGVGFRALEQGAQARNNTAMGDSALWHIQGEGNTAAGYVVAEGMSQGDRNVILGRAAARYRDNADDSILLGELAGAITSNAANCDFTEDDPNGDVGGATAGDRVIGIGTKALEECLASDVVAVGHQAGRSIVGTAGVTLDSTFLGNDAGSHVSQKVDASNSMALGANTYTDKNNQVVLGDANVAETVIRGVTRHTTFTAASLPSAATMGAGARAFVTDSNASIGPGLGNIVAGGGANKVPVYSDGTNWRIG